MNREKVKALIIRLLDKATDAQLRVICMVAYHVTR